MPGLLESLGLKRKPEDTVRAQKVENDVSAQETRAGQEHLILDGKLAARVQSIRAASAKHDYDKADAAVTKLTNDLDEEKKSLTAEKKKYDDDKQALETGDLAKMPGTAPEGLDAPFNAVGTAKGNLPTNPTTLADYKGANKALDTLKTKTTAFLDRKKTVDDGLNKYSSTGSNLGDLKGGNTLTATQKPIFDDALRKRLAGQEKPLSEKQVKEIAQKIVDKTNKLAETKLSGKINEELAKSPILKENIVKLQKDGWTVKYGKRGKGSFCNKGQKLIVIDPSDSTAETLGGLSHETGHATFTPPPKPSMDDSGSAAEFIRKNVEVDFIDEGNAQLMACRTKKELETAGVTANVPAESNEMEIYGRLERNEITEDQARKEMAKSFGNLKTSTTKEPYKVYYGKFYINQWNDAHKDQPPVTEDVLDTITLFP